MVIYVVVQYEDVGAFGMCGDTEFVTKTEIHQAYGNKQDAKIECKHLNQANKRDNILYDVIETELYWCTL